MNIGENIKINRMKRGMTQLDLAYALGHKNNGLVSKYEKGKINPPIDVMQKIAEILKLDLEKLLTPPEFIDLGGGVSVNKEYLEERKKEFENSVTENKRANKGIPVYDKDFTAGDITQFDDFQEKVIGYIDLNGFRKCKFFVKVKGNSMFPVFTAGDLVGLEPMEDISIIEYGQPFAIVTKSGQSLIKTIRKGTDNDNLILRSNNKEHDDIDIHKEQIERLYKAHGPIRDSHY